MWFDNNTLVCYHCFILIASFSCFAILSYSCSVLPLPSRASRRWTSHTSLSYLGWMFTKPCKGWGERNGLLQARVSRGKLFMAYHRLYCSGDCGRRMHTEHRSGRYVRVRGVARRTCSWKMAGCTGRWNKSSYYMYSSSNLLRYPMAKDTLFICRINLVFHVTSRNASIILDTRPYRDNGQYCLSAAPTIFSVGKIDLFKSIHGDQNPKKNQPLL